MIKHYVGLLLMFCSIITMGQKSSKQTIADDEKVVKSLVQVTFNCDVSTVSYFDPIIFELGLTGSFVDWAEPGSDEYILLSDEDGDRIYSTTIELNMNQEISYKYFINQIFSYQDTIGEPITSNRIFMIENEGVVLNNVWGQDGFDGLFVPFTTAPLLDGFIGINEPWSDKWVYQNLVGPGGYTEDMFSKFQMVHDGEFIYLLVEVEDTTPANDPDLIPLSYERDCIQTFFSFKADDFENCEYTDGDHFFRCQRDNPIDEFVDGFETVADLLESGNVEYGVASAEHGYLIEMAFNIDALAGESNFNGINFRFDLATVDNTTGIQGGITQKRFWNSDFDIQWNNTCKLGNVTLEGADTNRLFADFGVNETSGETPFIVDFIDLSTGNPTSWSWDFNNDGIEDANIPNPTCIFTEEGIYTINLIVSNQEETASKTKSDYIVVEEATNNIVVPLKSASIIDGVIDENDPWMENWIDQSLENEFNTTYDMTSRFQMVRDEDNIYLVVEVEDATPNNDVELIPYSFYRDCIEVYFSMKSSAFEMTDYEEGDHQIRCQRDSDIGEFVDGIYGFDGGVNAQGVDPEVLELMEYAVESNESSYIIEMSFPIQELAGNSNFDGTNFRFDLCTKDNTTGDGEGMTQRSFWNSNTDQQWYNTGLFGAAAFGEGGNTTDYFPVSFNVVDQNTIALDGANVKLTGYFGELTDTLGNAVFATVLPTEEIGYIVSKDGYISASGTISVSDSTVSKQVMLHGIDIGSDENHAGLMENKLLVYPNPVTETLTINVSQSVKSLIIFNIHGQIVHKFKKEYSNNGRYMLNMSDLPSGVYFVKADANVERVIKE